MTTLSLERRRHERNIVVRPCKVRDRRNLLFSPGQTHDVSESGALLKVDSARSFAPGDEVEVAVAWNHDAVLMSEGLVKARVRRVFPIDYHHQAIALEFERTDTVASTGGLAKAA